MCVCVCFTLSGGRLLLLLLALRLTAHRAAGVQRQDGVLGQKLLLLHLGGGGGGGGGGRGGARGGGGGGGVNLRGCCSGSGLTGRQRRRFMKYLLFSFQTRLPQGSPSVSASCVTHRRAECGSVFTRSCVKHRYFIIPSPDL